MEKSREKKIRCPNDAKYFFTKRKKIPLAKQNKTKQKRKPPNKNLEASTWKINGSPLGRPKINL